MNDLAIANKPIVIDNYTLSIDQNLVAFQVTSKKKFTDIFLWDGKGNCIGFKVENSFAINGDQYLHHLNTQIFEVATNITDRRNSLEFILSFTEQDIFQLTKDQYSQVKEIFLIDFKNKSQI